MCEVHRCTQIYGATRNKITPVTHLFARLGAPAHAAMVTPSGNTGIMTNMMPKNQEAKGQF